MPCRLAAMAASACRQGGLALALVLGLALSSCARLQAAPAWPAAATAACVPQAAHRHGVDPWLLAAILQVESGFRPHVVQRNRNGTLDVGLAQINSIHFPELARHGVMPAHLLEPCVASHVAAWHLARQLKAQGHTWRGLASYHSATPCHNQRYAAQVWNTLAGWGAVAGPRVAVLPREACNAGSPAPSDHRR